MATSDLGHKLTDKELAKLERRIAKLYREAGEELQVTIDAYFEQFAKRDEEMKALIGTVQNGKEWTEADYKQWRLNQIGRGERYQAMRDKVAHRVTDANAVAVSYTNDATPGIYSLNRNYSSYTIEQVAGNVGFDLWDEQTVKRLMGEQPDLMPYYPPKRALKRGIDLAYGKKQITASVTSSILQGKSIKHMADDLQKRITTMSRDSAIRTARTAVTGAQNAGRMDSYAAAEKMGIKLKKEWLATLDARTRHSHAMLDGEQVAQDKKFSNGCRFPGDPQGPPWEIYNCRCTLIAAVEGVDTSTAQRRARNADTGQTEVISDMSYAEWAGWKKKTGLHSITTVEDIEILFRSQDWFIHGEGELSGWRSDEALSLSGLDVQGAKIVYSSYAQFFDKLPQFKNKLAAPISAKLDKTTYAECTMGFGSGLVNINRSKYSDYNRLSSHIDKAVKDGWFASKDMIMHELGHAVDDYLSVNKNILGVSGKKATDFVSNKIRAKILKDSGIKLSDIKSEVSEYATTNAHEWFAECFAEYMTSENPRKCAKVFGDWLVKVMDDIK